MQGGSASIPRAADGISRGHCFNDHIITLVRVIGHYCETSGALYVSALGLQRCQPLATGLPSLAMFPPWLAPGIKTLIEKEMGSYERVADEFCFSGPPAIGHDRRDPEIDGPDG